MPAREQIFFLFARNPPLSAANPPHPTTTTTTASEILRLPASTFTFVTNTAGGCHHCHLHNGGCHYCRVNLDLCHQTAINDTLLTYISATTINAAAAFIDLHCQPQLLPTLPLISAAAQLGCAFPRNFPGIPQGFLEWAFEI